MNTKYIQRNGFFRFEMNFGEAGYTLVELLASIVVMITVGVILMSIFVSGLRGSNKTTSVTSVTENGSYAMQQMAKEIRSAQTFEGVSTDGTAYTTDCLVTSVGALTPTPTPVDYQYIKFVGYGGGETTYTCDYMDQGHRTIASMSATTIPLLDTSVAALDSCTFSCTQSDISDSPVIGISFALTKYSSLGIESLFENTASSGAIPFYTVVTVRNRGR